MSKLSQSPISISSAHAGHADQEAPLACDGLDMALLEPPPVVVAVVGPPRIGQSTLISSLVKTCSRQTLTDVKGPVTVVSGGDAWGVHVGLLCSGRVGSVPCVVT